jgi:hypothetical protein
MYLILALIAVIAMVGLGFAIANWRQHSRNVAIQALLDDADRLEACLLETRTRMRQLEGMLGRLPADITESARASLASEAGIQDAMKRVLSHRLWIRENAMSATVAKLREVGETARKSLVQLQQQLARLDGAGVELQAAYAQSDALMGATQARNRRPTDWPSDAPAGAVFDLAIPARPVGAPAPAVRLRRARRRRDPVAR